MSTSCRTEKIADKVKSVRRFVLLNDHPELPTTTLPVAGEYEAMLAASSPYFHFPDFDENTRATDLPHDRHDRAPKGVYFSHRQLVLHVLCANGRIWYGSEPGPYSSRRRLICR